MGEKENLALIERLWKSAGEEYSAMEECLADDCVQEWPQSRERVRGKQNMIAIMQNYPGLPASNVRRMIAGGKLVIAEIELDYGRRTYDGISIYEIEDGKIVRETDYFAEPFDAPAWRAQWVERF